MFRKSKFLAIKIYIDVELKEKQRVDAFLGEKRNNTFKENMAE